jgi:hypothetical protein
VEETTKFTLHVETEGEGDELNSICEFADNAERKNNVSGDV